MFSQDVKQKSKKAKYKILVVDDEPDLRPLFLQHMRRPIRSKTYDFVFAHDGFEALEKLNTEEGIDMVLSDINMPKMDGLTLLERIPEVSSEIKAVIVSAYGDMDNIRLAMNRGAFDFITKPIDFKDLKITVKRTLDHIEEWRKAFEAREKLLLLQNELTVASMIQQSILPERFVTDGSYKLFGAMQPASNIGGDFFDVINLPDGKVGLVIADVSGKGVPAALFMMLSRTVLRSVTGNIEEPGEVLAVVNDQLHEDNESCMFVTMLYIVYDPNTNELVYSSGGHDPPLLVRSDGSSVQLELTDGMALGIVPDLKYQQSSCTLNQGDSVVLYTDGVTEAINTDEEQLGIERVREVFKSKPPMSAKQSCDSVVGLVEDFARGMPQFDDTTCLVLQCKELPVL